MQMKSQDITTPSELDAQLVLEATTTIDLLKQLALLTEQERQLAVVVNTVKAAADKIEALVLQRMMTDDTPSITVTMPDGKKMKFSISSRTYPKMVAGSLVAAKALQEYAERLQVDGRYDDADAILGMLTIKGQSLAPLLNEWMLEDMEMPPEFEGAIEPSTRFSLSKRKA
jgi:hypothetical protein